MKIVLGIILFLFIVYLLVCAGIYTSQERLLFFPSKLTEDYKFSFSSSFTEIQIPVDEGVFLHGLHFASHSTSKGFVLYFHGNAGAMDNWGFAAEEFVNRGYDIFILDYRGFGKSSGNIGSERQLYSDVKKVYEHFLEEYKESEIIVYGRSIGTAPASWLAAEMNPSLLALETPHYNMIELLRHYAPFLPVKYILRYPFRNDLFLPKVKCPVFILHGTDDEVIPYKEAEKLKALNIKALEFMTVKNGAHNNLSVFKEYEQFLNKILLN